MCCISPGLTADTSGHRENKAAVISTPLSNTSNHPKRKVRWPLVFISPFPSHLQLIKLCIKLLHSPRPNGVYLGPKSCQDILPNIFLSQPIQIARSVPLFILTPFSSLLQLLIFSILNCYIRGYLGPQSFQQLLANFFLSRPIQIERWGTHCFLFPPFPSFLL